MQISLTFVYVALATSLSVSALPIRISSHNDLDERGLNFDPFIVPAPPRPTSVGSGDKDKRFRFGGISFLGAIPPPPRPSGAQASLEAQFGTPSVVATPENTQVAGGEQERRGFNYYPFLGGVGARPDVASLVPQPVETAQSSNSKRNWNWWQFLNGGITKPDPEYIPKDHPIHVEGDDTVLTNPDSSKRFFNHFDFVNKKIVHPAFPEGPGPVRIPEDKVLPVEDGIVTIQTIDPAAPTSSLLTPESKRFFNHFDFVNKKIQHPAFPGEPGPVQLPGEKVPPLEDGIVTIQTIDPAAPTSSVLVPEVVKREAFNPADPWIPAAAVPTTTAAPAPYVLLPPGA